MSVDANALERETLERKDRDELSKIVGALGGKATTRTRKADLIDQILELTGVTGGEQTSGGETSGDAAEGEADSGSTKQDDSGDSARGKDAEGDDEDDRGAGRERSKGSSGGTQAKQSGASKRSDASEQAGRSNKDESSKQSGKSTQDETSKRTDDDTSDDDNGNRGGADDKGGSDNQGDQDGGGKRRRRRGRNRDAGGQQDEYSGEPIPVVGCLDLRDDGYGFLRVDGMLPSKDDCYVSVKQVRQFGLRKGDVIAGGSRPAFRNEKNPALLRIDTVNDVELEPGTERPLFEELEATFPTEPLPLVLADEPHDRTTRAIDLLAPLGKGSRALVLAPPRSGKTTLLQTVARSVEVNEPDTPLIVVLLDERPEEITEMRNVVAGHTVYGSPFDASPDEHVAVLELAVARAQRMAEAGDDVVFLVDGLTRLARAAHAASHGVGRSLGGLDVAALQTAKRCFGAGRDLADAGSITVVATANVDTGSEVDEAVVDAVMGAANVHIRLDRFAAERRAFPALDVGATGTRHEELLVGSDRAEQRDALRGLLADSDDMLDGLLERLRNTDSNDELLDAVAKETS